MVDRFHDYYDSPLDSGYSLPFRNQGTTTNPSVPNQITELGMKLNTGIKNVEIGALNPDTFDTIPLQHLDEMRRIAKLTDSKVSLHAPLIDPAGFNKEGRWSEEERRQNEMQISSIIERAHRLDPDGNIPVTIHSSSGIPGVTYYKEKGKPERAQMMVAVQQETGQLIPLKYEELDHIGGKRIYTPEDRLDILNQSTWEEEKLKLHSYQKTLQELDMMNRRIEIENPNYLTLSMKEKSGQELSDKEKSLLDGMKQQVFLNEKHKERYISHILSGLNDIHHKYQKTKFDQNKLSNEERFQAIKADEELIKLRTDMEKSNKRRVEVYANLADSFKKGKIKIEDFQLKKEELNKDMEQMNNRILNVITELPAPQTYKPVNDFAREKLSETISNVALNSYKKFGTKAPIISIENVYPEWTLSRAGSLKKAVEETRNQFANKLIKEKNLGKDEAKKIAEKMIGVTWDVGHINMLRKHGYTEEDIRKEAKEIAPLVKHLHITDNFGYGDTHLTPGMGNVPLRQQLEELEKAGRLDKIRQIVEGGGLPQHYKTSSVPYQMTGLNSPLYSMDSHTSWPEMKELYASYMTGYGEQFLPSGHYQSYGAGFSANLPRELGGQSPGARSRFSGTPNQ